MFAQGADDAEVGEGAGAAAGQGDADGAAGEPATEARPVVGGIFPQMKTRVGPAGGGGCGGAAGGGRAVGMQHEKNASQAGGEEVGRQRRDMPGAREEQDGVGAAQALTVPGRVGWIAGHDEMGGGGFHLVEPDGKPAAMLAFLCGGGRLAAGGEHGGVAAAADLLLEFDGKSGGIAGGVGGEHHDGEPLFLERARTVGALDAVELDFGDVNDGLRAGAGQFVERRAVEAGQHAVAEGGDGGGADITGEQRHLADGFAAADVADGAFMAVVLPGGAEASADHDIHGVGGVAFAEKDFAGAEFFPADGGEEFFPDAGFEVAEFLVQHLAEERGVGLLECGVGCTLTLFLKPPAQRINQVASPRKSPMLTTSVAVVRKMLEAVAGSAPRRCRIMGMTAPAAPLITQLPVMARKTMNGEHGVVLVPLPKGEGEHAECGGDSDEGAVGQAEEGFLGDNRGSFARFEFAEGHAAQGDGEGLAAGVAGLPGKDGEKDRKGDDLRDGLLENADDEGRNEGGEEVELQPGVAHFQTADERGGEAFFFLHADHGAGLRGEFEGLGFGQGLSTDEADETPIRLANGVDRIVATERGFHRLEQRCVRLQEERVAQHEIAEAALRRVEQQVAGGDDAGEFVIVFRDEAVGDELVLGEFPEALDGRPHGVIGAEDGRRRLHQATDGILRIPRLEAPTGGDLGRGGGEDGAGLVGGKLLEDGVGGIGQQPTEHLRGEVGILLRQKCRSIRPRARHSAVRRKRFLLIGHGNTIVRKKIYECTYEAAATSRTNP